MGSPFMLRLRSNRPDMSSAGGCLFFRRGARVDPAVTAIVADSVIRAAAPFVLLAHGEDTVIQKGTTYEVFTDTR